MSFGVLSTVSPHPVLILERECVGKTWPGWWDIMSQSFHVQLEGVEEAHGTHGKETTRSGTARSVFIIGMRGAGKTIAGQWMSEILKRPFLDLDDELERREGITIPEIIRGERGWEGFRKAELDVLEDVIKNRSIGHILSCGGGIVESEAARKLLISYHQSGGPVLLVHRDTDKVVEYLMRDKTRPAYSEDIRGVYERRKPWFEECSNFQYHSPHPGNSDDLLEPPTDFARFLSVMCGGASHLDAIKTKSHSFFVSLTFPNISAALDIIPRAVVGSDAVELRVDLLEDFDPEFVTTQVALLRSAAKVPIVYTVRTVSQGGRFPDDAYDLALKLYQVGLRTGVEYLDLEMTMPEHIIQAVTDAKGFTRIVASHHDPTAKLSWKNGGWVPYYNKALQHGDVIKLVGVAGDMVDNFALANFKAKMLTAHDKPIIALNMGAVGKLSRVLNGFMTPVSHPALPSKAAPGQLSAAEIRQALALIGEIESRSFYLFGKPILSSRSPALHNALFKQSGLPHSYSLFETDNAQDVQDLIRSSHFGGASVTIPLKLDIVPLLDEVSDAARIIGAVNTVIPVGSGKPILLGDNTDWMGMVFSLRAAGLFHRTRDDQGAGMVVGSGGTTRAAIYALHNLGYAPIYVVARSPDRVKELADSFPAEYNIRALATPEEVAALAEGALPGVVISSIPADKPIDQGMREVLVASLRHPSPAGAKTPRVLLEMAYTPLHTPLMQLAEDAGWKTIPGLEVLAAQGWNQFRLWTGIEPVFADARAAVIGQESEE